MRLFDGLRCQGEVFVALKLYSFNVFFDPSAEIFEMTDD